MIMFIIPTCSTHSHTCEWTHFFLCTKQQKLSYCAALHLQAPTQGRVSKATGCKHAASRIHFPFLTRCLLFKDQNSTTHWIIRRVRNGPLFTLTRLMWRVDNILIRRPLLARGGDFCCFVVWRTSKMENEAASRVERNWKFAQLDMKINVDGGCRRWPCLCASQWDLSSF